MHWLCSSSTEHECTFLPWQNMIRLLEYDLLKMPRDFMTVHLFATGGLELDSNKSLTNEQPCKHYPHGFTSHSTRYLCWPQKLLLRTNQNYHNLFVCWWKKRFVNSFHFRYKLFVQPGSVHAALATWLAAMRQIEIIVQNCLFILCISWMWSSNIINASRKLRQATNRPSFLYLLAKLFVMSNLKFLLDDKSFRNA